MTQDSEKKQKWSQPPWWWFAIAVIGIGGTGATLWNNNRLDAKKVAREETQRQEDLARMQAEEERNKPYLKFLNGSGPRTDGFTHLTYHNQSLVRNGVIDVIEFIIDDETQLAIIARAHPRVPPIIGASIDKEVVKLIHGTWNPQLTTYTFYVYPQKYVEADKPIELVTCIVDPKLVGQNFRGLFRMNVPNGRADELKQTTLRVHKQ
jgi:hypothetical protein